MYGVKWHSLPSVALVMNCSIGGSLVFPVRGQDLGLEGSGLLSFQSLGGLRTGACPRPADLQLGHQHSFFFLQPGASRILARPHKGGHIPQPQHLLGRY